MTELTEHQIHILQLAGVIEKEDHVLTEAQQRILNAATHHNTSHELTNYQKHVLRQARKNADAPFKRTELTLNKQENNDG